MTTLRLPFSNGVAGEPFEETVEAVPMDEVQYYLTSHTTFAPLAPGDVVTADADRVVTSVVRLVPLWTVEATFHLPVGTTMGLAFGEEHPAMKAVAEVEAEWRRAAWVTRDTAFSVLVSSQTRAWLEDNVEAHPYVEHIDLVRAPDMEADLEGWLRSPSFL